MLHRLAHTLLIIATGSCLLSCCGESGPVTGVDYLIVADEDLEESAERYREYRERSGYSVELAYAQDLGAAGPARVEGIRDLVRRRYEHRDAERPFYLLLLGDGSDPIPAGVHVDPQDQTEIASDNIYADMDGDDIPDLAPGRITARSNEEVDLIRQKIERYETSYEPGPWNRRINVFASTGGYTGSLDQVIENIAMDIADTISYDYDFSLTYAAQNSPFVYIPQKLSDMIYQRLNEGALFVTYLGHGNEQGLDRLTWNDREYAIWDVEQLEAKLEVEHKLPILAIVACLTGAFLDDDALAEQVLRLDRAPPAIIASTEISHPYANAILTRELAVVATEHLEPTVGLLFQRGKERLVHQQDSLRKTMDLLGALMLSEQEREALKRTHLHMYTLFGDPAMSLQVVRGRAEVSIATDKINAGADLQVTVDFDNLDSGRATFSLETRRKVILEEIQTVPGDDDPTRDEVIDANYRSANNKVVVAEDVDVSDRRASVTLSVPADLPKDTYYIKVYASSGDQDAFGHRAITIVQ